MSTSISTEYGSLFANGACFLGLVPFALGINALLRPESALALLQFAAPPQPEAQKLTKSFIYMQGARNLAYGFTTLAIWYTGHREPLGYAAFAGMFIVLVDGFVARYQLGRGEWNHWAFAPVSVAVGAGLLGWI
ncbi:hypothetical protein LTR10_023489 [Elasticomyces elasticus]|uniref:DUF1304 domain-containing protein n=1 Tax=Exophiala sideris TaxID=1016849 RepID=A0ABR0J709_9EURO|nr:hypothetical protein LTR10_023489 [Elasticomyces elasticus]KAK5028824.1 hypothetical protein LTS07_006203 [Exophiala sideris]KAK5035693.1 hypothetical protein LTR13_005822 [Exophiala sideris]KAK5057328.1 hypothetical protein LTR69_007367 [Exophiala sideris]